MNSLKKKSSQCLYSQDVQKHKRPMANCLPTTPLYIDNVFWLYDKKDSMTFGLNWSIPSLNVFCWVGQSSVITSEEINLYFYCFRRYRSTQYLFSAILVLYYFILFSITPSSGHYVTMLLIFFLLPLKTRKNIVIFKWEWPWPIPWLLHRLDTR